MLGEDCEVGLEKGGENGKGTAYDVGHKRGHSTCDDAGEDSGEEQEQEQEKQEKQEDRRVGGLGEERPWSQPAGFPKTFVNLNVINEPVPTSISQGKTGPTCGCTTLICATWHASLENPSSWYSV